MATSLDNKLDRQHGGLVGIYSPCSPTGIMVTHCRPTTVHNSTNSCATPHYKVCITHASSRATQSAQSTELADHRFTQVTRLSQDYSIVILLFLYRM